MKIILINGLNAKTGGGKSILNNYLNCLHKNNCENLYLVLTPDKRDYLKYQNQFINIIDINKYFKKNVLLPITYGYLLNKLIVKYKITTIFNLADIPIATKEYQVLLFDWSYAVYPKSIVWKKMKFHDYFKRKFKLHFFKKYLKYVDIVISQNKVMKARLVNLYSLKKVEIINNAVSVENLRGENNFNFNLPKGINLVYLTHYYPHKNIEIFIPLAQEIKRQGLNYNIITTIDESQDKAAKKFLRDIVKLNLQKIIINVGAVKMDYVPSLYIQCDGLLMPTLLESFSGTYVEAMYHGIPIFTSDLDFAKVVCGKAAKYFNPFDVADIILQLNSVYTNDNEKITLKKEAIAKLSNFSTWEEAYIQYQNVILKNIKFNE
ncbi:MAG: glycosyltransferase [Crocinitomicaceae bacterium]